MTRGEVDRQVQAKRGYHHGDLRRALIASANKLLESRGPAALSLREVARGAGVTQAAPYRHFADKEALLAAVAEDGFRALGARLREAAERHPAEPLARLVALGRAYVEFASRHPTHFRVMFGNEIPERRAHPSLQAAAEQAFAFLHATVADAQSAGLLRPVPGHDLTLLAWSVVHGLGALVVDGQAGGLGLGAAHAGEVAARLGRLLLEGAAQPGAAGASRETSGA